MGLSGGFGPSGLTGRQARTLFLGVPEADWTSLTQGYKTEFRRPYRGDASTIIVPTPVVIYTSAGQGRPARTKLMVLLEYRVERLIDMDGNEQSLMREGFQTYAHFRTYWRQRTRRPWRPLDKVEAFTLAPWNEVVKPAMAQALIERLYGEWM